MNFTNYQKLKVTFWVFDSKSKIDGSIFGRLSHDTSELRKFVQSFIGKGKLSRRKPKFYRIETGTYSVVAARWNLWTRPGHVPWRPDGPKWYDWRTFFSYRLFSALLLFTNCCLLWCSDPRFLPLDGSVCCLNLPRDTEKKTLGDTPTRDERRHTSAADGWTRKNFVTSSRALNKFSSQLAGIFPRTRTRKTTTKTVKNEWWASLDARNSPLRRNKLSKWEKVGVGCRELRWWVWRRETTSFGE